MASLCTTSTADEHEIARWHHARRAAQLRLHIKVTLRDLDELMARPEGVLAVRRRLEDALIEDRETT